MVCCNTKTELNQNVIQSEVTSLKNTMNCVEEQINVVIETGTTFCTVLRHATDTASTSAGKDATAIRSNIAQKMEFVADNLTVIGNRRKRCCELVKLRISRLEQIEEIIKCENFGNEIIEKMNECFISVQRGRPTLTTIVNHRKTEKRLYNYAKHLSHVACVLRKLHNHELRPNTALIEKLEATWKKLNAKPTQLMRYG